MRVAVLVLAFVACKKKDEPPAAPVSFATYNAGLAVGFVPGAESRLDALADAIGAIDADIVCLQEVWLPDQVAAVDAAAAANFPNRFFPAASQSTDATCAAGEITPVTDCLDQFCADACADQVPDCLLTNCVDRFLGLTLPCQRCAQANVGNNPASVADTCENAPVEYAYGGSFGTGILSKFPLGPVEEHVFSSTSNRRSVLHTTVEAPSGPIELWCTHLTAVFTTIPYPRDGGTVFGADAWAAEQAVQIDEMLGLVDAGGGQVALLGDMNTGPAIGDIAAEVPENWPKFANADFAIPYVEQAAPECTYCADNPLQLGNADDGDSRLIDHILLRGFEAPVADRIMDEPTVAETCGTPIDPAALSDHYGVHVTATPTAPAAE